MRARANILRIEKTWGDCLIIYLCAFIRGRQTAETCMSITRNARPPPNSNLREETTQMPEEKQDLLWFAPMK